jgi:hypothetical protein
MIDHATLVLLDHQIMPDRRDARIELDLVVDVGESGRLRGHLDHDHRIGHQIGALVERGGAGHHHVGDPAFIALEADSYAWTSIVHATRQAGRTQRLS